jgi:long-chain fatty acid transport protein
MLTNDQSRRLVLVVLAASVASTWAPARAVAEGGYFSGQAGARAAGRSGAFVAKADDLSAVLFNPAGLADLDASLIQLGNQISYNGYTYTRATTLDYGNPQNGVAPSVAFATVENGRPWQPLEPLLGVASHLGLPNWGFALAALAPPGTGREQFPIDGGQRYVMVSREAIILSYVASAAWRYHEVFGIGATAEWIAVPRLDYSLVIDGTPFAGAANPVSSQLDMLATMSGSDWFTFNAILGAWFRPTPSLELGVAGQVVPANVVAHSRLSVTPLQPSLGDVVLTRDGAPANDVTVTLPMPLLARVGARYRHLRGGRELFDVELDLEYETWSRVNRFSVGTNHLQANYAGQTINLDRIDIEKHWRDTLGVKLGGDFAAIPGRLTLRGGLFYVTATSDAAYASVDFASAAQLGGSAGTSVRLGQHWELSVAYQIRIQPRVSVSETDARVYQQVPGSACQAPYTDPATCNPNTLGRPAPVVNAGTYEARSHLVSLDAIFRFGP